jgi:hypothetical protein
MMAVVAGVMLTWAMGPAPAQPNNMSPRSAMKEYAPPAVPKGPTAQQLVVRLFLMTGLTVTGAGVVIWLARRGQRGGGNAHPGGGSLEVIESITLEGQASVHLIRAEESTFLLSADARGLTSLTPLTEPFEQILDGLQGEETQTELPSLGVR